MTSVKKPVIQAARTIHVPKQMENVPVRTDSGVTFATRPAIQDARITPAHRQPGNALAKIHSGELTVTILAQVIAQIQNVTQQQATVILVF